MAAVQWCWKGRTIGGVLIRHECPTIKLNRIENKFVVQKGGKSSLAQLVLLRVLQKDAES